MTVHMTVLVAGLVMIQDLGRVGYEHLGIAVNGAADQLAATVANILVGNDDSAAHLEIVASDFAFVASAPLLVSVTGAPSRVTVDGNPCRMWDPLVVNAGQRLEVRGMRDGLQTYLAVAGSLLAPSVMGSCTPDPLLEVGRYLTTGDTLDVETTFPGLDHPVLRHPLFMLRAPVPTYGAHVTVAITPGPDVDQYDDALDGLARATYRVGRQSNHIGLRLEGAVPTRLVDHEILSRGVPVGAIEAPPDGGLLALLRGRHVTAGYPVLAVATHHGRRALGQAAPGHTVGFQLVTLERAIAAHAAEAEELRRLRDRVRTAFDALSLPRPVPHAGPGHRDAIDQRTSA